MITIQLPLTTSIKSAVAVGRYLKKIGMEYCDVTTGETVDIVGMNEPGKETLLHQIRRTIAEAEMPW